MTGRRNAACSSNTSATAHAASAARCAASAFAPGSPANRRSSVACTCCMPRSHTAPHRPAKPSTRAYRDGGETPLRLQTSLMVSAAAPPSSSSCRPVSSTRSQESRLRACLGSRTAGPSALIGPSCPWSARSGWGEDAVAHLLQLRDDLARAPLAHLSLQERGVVEHEVPDRPQRCRRVVEHLPEHERLLHLHG